MRRRAVLLAGIALSILCLPAGAKADLVLGPEVFVIPAAMLFFVVFALAVLARLFLAGLRGKRKKGEGSAHGYGGELAVAAIVSILFFLFAWGGSEGSRKRRIRNRPHFKSNLGAIRGTQVAFFAEWNHWIGNQPCTPVLDRSKNSKKTAWDGTTRFSILGFAPEGNVSCSYCLEGNDRPTAAEGFTARAECDLDGDGKVAIYTITNRGTEIVKSGAPF